MSNTNRRPRPSKVLERKRKLALALRMETDYTNTAIADKMGVNRRTVQRWLAANAGERARDQAKRPRPKTAVDVKDPEVLACFEDSPAGFEAFFNRYSPWTMAAHAREFVDAAFDAKVEKWRNRMILTVPPNHAKSTTYSVWFPIWRICLDRSHRIIVLSETADLALAFTNAIAAVLDTNADLIRDFGVFKPDEPPAYTWMPGSGKLRVEGFTHEKGWNILARGSQQQVQGMRADLIVADDVVDDENVLTEDRRRKLMHWFMSIVSTRMSPTSRLFVVGTRQHLHDLYGELAAKRKPGGEPIYTHISIPALRDPLTGEPSMAPEAIPLWRHDPEMGECDLDDCRERTFLDAQYAELGAHVFQQTYQGVPIPPESVTVRPEWVYGAGGGLTDDSSRDTVAHEAGVAAPWAERACLDLDRGLGQARWSRTDPENPVVRVLSIDPSPTQYSGWVLGDIRIGERMAFAVLDCDRRKRFGHRDTIGLIERIAEGYGPLDYVIFEVNAAERHFFEQPDVATLRKAHEIRFLEHTTGRNKSDPGFGLSSMAGDFEFGRIRLPYEDFAARMASKRLIEEVTQHPFGLTDDIFMALWFVKNKLRELRVRRKEPQEQVKGTGFHIPPRLQGRRWVQ